MVRRKTIEQTYKSMDEIEHILLRPGMYVGSTRLEERKCFVYDNDDNLMTLRTIEYVPAMLKIFDEVLSNSCDEYRRETNLGLTKIEVTVNKNGKIIIRDNGGIPIVKHKQAGCYVPEFIFGQLRTSSNYDDNEDRQLIGTNGVGSALCNVFSSQFIIDSADGKNSFHRSWSNNMQTLNDDLKIKKSKDHFTQTTFYIDFDKFNISEKTLNDDIVLMMQKRCIDAAAANLKLRITFKYIDEHEKTVFNNVFVFKNFEHYIELYNDFIDNDTSFKFSDNQKSVWIYPGNASINVGFVDGAECSRGTHINATRLVINKAIRELLSKKKIDVTLGNIDAKYSMFCMMNVTNPEYDSQTKECLTTPADKFCKDDKWKFTLPDDFIKRALKSEIVDLVLDWYKRKQEADDIAKIRKMNRESGKLLRSDKFINCNSKKASERQLWIFEGDSAAAGFRQGRNSQTQAGYLMRGVPLNSIEMSATAIMKNQVLNDIVKILGLKWGEYNHVEDLKYQKIVIASDRDFDGHKIAALMIVFFNHFPELFDQHVICRIVSPIIIATKGTGKRADIKKYYTLEAYRAEQKKLKGYEIKYIKGLGGQNVSQYREMMQSNKFEYYTKNEITDNILNKWFGKGIASVRKDMLRDNVEA